MNLTEIAGKALFSEYGIPIPKGKPVSRRVKKAPMPAPFILKSQVLSGDRKKKGGIAIVKSARQFPAASKRLFATAIDGARPDKLLAEELVPSQDEYYVSFSFDTAARTPALSLSASGGSGISRAKTTPIDLASPVSEFIWRDALLDADLPLDRPLIKIVSLLWKIFTKEKLLLAEINPLFKLKDGDYIAGDAKIILDDNIINPGRHPFHELGGDIGIIASGGGASMINLDALINAGGRPANYIEYSGNPKAEVVTEVTKRVLSRPGLKGAWVVGGTANFTDNYETLRGFLQGLRQIRPKPEYPIVIRRDGPRRAEAFAMLAKAQREEAFNFHLFGPETPMAATAKIIVGLAYRQAGLAYVNSR